MADYEIYEGITEQGRKKTYLVFSSFEYGYLVHSKALALAKRYFRASEKHIKIVYGYVVKDELYLLNPKKRPRNSKLVRVAYYVW